MTYSNDFFVGLDLVVTSNLMVNLTERNIKMISIEKFEQRHGVTWDDIGIRMKGVSLHQA